MNLIIVTIILATAGLLAVRWTLAALVQETAAWRKALQHDILCAASSLLLRLDHAVRDTYPEVRKILSVSSAKLQPPETAPAEPMPDEISRLINQWPDQWARDGNEGHARDLYKSHKDWSKVYQILLQEDKANY